MKWLNDLEQEHSLYSLAEECISRVMESYYLIYADHQQDDLPED